MKDFQVFNIIYAVDEYKPFGLEKQSVSTSFNRFNRRVSASFTQVAALSRVERLNSIFN